MTERWRIAQLDRRAVARAEYKRTAPGLLELEEAASDPEIT